MDGIQEHLAFDPLIETRNRKKLRPNPLAPWALRLGHLRVFYEVRMERPREVRILAVGTKVRNRLIVQGEAIDL